ncbi:MAG: RdgB/HAM1 family non-canonical purine NTP pyrophosphatase [Chloroflexota bacterium]
MNRLLVATNNPGKMLELHALLNDLAVFLVTPEDAGLVLSVTEDGRSYLENAQKKAAAFAAASGLISLADDSGLEVEVLDGAPGLHSARYLAHAGATDADRRAFLLQNLSGKPRPWRARFRAAVAISVPGGETRGAEGDCPGEIIPEERGAGGFGYDPIFLVSGTGRTMAELDMHEKNRVSHRARAIAKARPMLKQLLRG